MHAPLAVEVGLPLKTEINVLGIVHSLDNEVDDAVLAGDRRRFEIAALDDSVAKIAFATGMAGEAGHAFRDLPCAHVAWAHQPAVSR